MLISEIVMNLFGGFVYRYEKVYRYNFNNIVLIKFFFLFFCEVEKSSISFVIFFVCKYMFVKNIVEIMIDFGVN